MADTTNARFWSKVDRRGDNECWPWTASRKHDKWGQFDGQRADAVAYRLTHGALSADMDVGQRCGNLLCCNPAHLVSFKRPTLSERFWAKVAKGDPGKCWEWQGALNSSGYGSFAAETRRADATHRMAYRLTAGEPGAAHVLHRCDNRKCCNPAHLFLGTNADNVADRVRKGRSVREGPRAKLDWRRVEEIRRLLRMGESNSSIARRYGVKQHTISTIKTGKAWPERFSPIEERVNRG